MNPGCPLDSFEEDDRGHDRDERRQTWVTTDFSWLPESRDWVGMKSIVCVEAYRKPLDKPAWTHRRFYRSSLDIPTAEQVARAVRAHLGPAEFGKGCGRTMRIAELNADFMQQGVG